MDIVIGVQTLDGWENVIGVGIAEVRVGLGRVRNTSGREMEGINGPGVRHSSQSARRRGS